MPQGRRTSGWVLTDKGDRIVLRMHELSLSKSILNTKSTPRVFPFDGTIDAGYLAGAAFQTTGIFGHHLSFFIQSIEVCRAGIDAKTFFATMTDVLVKLYMGLFVVFKGIQGQLFGNLHCPSDKNVKGQSSNVKSSSNDKTVKFEIWRSFEVRILRFGIKVF
jgi:hypothetical protein